jgi:nitroreductase
MNRQAIETQKRASLAFLEFMKKRHSVRHYDKQPVSRAVIENAIETAGRAPSGANQQPWHFVAIHLRMR